MNVKAALICVFAFAASAVSAQGYAGLAAEAEGFATPKRGEPLRFPEDHGPHPNFRIEWWYLTANLEASDGAEYGIQWTLFRSALAPGEGGGWQSPQIWFAHAALTSVDSHHFAERIARGGIGQAGVTATPFAAWIDDWEMLGRAGSDMEALSVIARGEDFGYSLTLAADGPLVLHGDAGYSVKSAAGQASYYYSQPHFRVSGEITLPSGPVQVTGHGWLDREWSSQPLAEDQSGWDWFSLRFDDGAKLMGFVLRGESGDFTSGTWITPEGSAEPLPPGAFQAEPLETSTVAGRELPTTWRVLLPEKALNAEIEALNPGAWMGTSFSYWEGPVRIRGSHRGRGYLEMTGYE
ncbi:lipocalin-like domain-containing protein [Cribrihabitans neustonicus]|uniref:lipocalin-like domain-containing protein n=1 Tax=Cribrihabitans neustonicus TaxID=1429085 RepID=UPI003B59D955